MRSSLARRALRPCWLLAILVGCAGQGADRLGEATPELRVCAEGATLPGIDVSYYQGDVDWAKVKAAGIQFAIARISHGLTYPDSQFSNNWPSIKAQGIVRGAYQYFAPDQDAVAQADLVVDRVGMLGEGDLPVQLDVETTAGQSASTIVAKMQLWLDRVAAGTGKRPYIYTAKYYWEDEVDSAQFGTYPLWVANYGVTCPDLPDTWQNWTIWQHSSTGSVSGIDGEVDLDWFNGDANGLARAAGVTPSYAAQYVAQSFPLASEGMSMTAGESVAAFIELKNTGTKPWNESTRLATSLPRDRSSAFAAPDWPAPNRPATVQGTVQPGQSYKFSFTLHAPAAPGVYSEYFNLVQEGVAWFSDSGQGGPPDDQLQNRITVIAPSADDDAGKGPDPGSEDAGPQRGIGGDGGLDAQEPFADAREASSDAQETCLDGSRFTAWSDSGLDAAKPSDRGDASDAAGDVRRPLPDASDQEWPQDRADDGCGCRMARARSVASFGAELSLCFACMLACRARRARRRSR